MSVFSMTRTRLQQGLLRRLYQARTWWMRNVRRRPSEEAHLRQRILDRVSQLGRWYEDGNSDLVQFTYHPIPFPGFESVNSHRKDMDDRLAAVVKAINPTPGDWVLDIGANVGYFSFSLEKKGAYVEAYESNSDTFEIGAALSKLHRANVLYLNKPFGTPALAYLRSHYKAVLLLSVFHWIVKQEGLEPATSLLQQLAERCDLILFETPCSEGEGMALHELFNSSAQVESYLRKSLPRARFEVLSSDPSWGGRNLYGIRPRG